MENFDQLACCQLGKKDRMYEAKAIDILLLQLSHQIFVNQEPQITPPWSFVRKSDKHCHHYRVFLRIVLVQFAHSHLLQNCYEIHRQRHRVIGLHLHLIENLNHYLEIQR